MVLVSESRLVPVYISKVHLANTYMCIWIWSEEITVIDFLTPKRHMDDSQLVGFYFPLGSRDSAPQFCMAIGTVVDISNDSIPCRKSAAVHLLEKAAEKQVEDDSRIPSKSTNTQWLQALTCQQSTALAEVVIYLKDFISVIEGGPKEWKHILMNMFHTTDKNFRPN